MESVRKKPKQHCEDAEDEIEVLKARIVELEEKVKLLAGVSR